MEPQDYDQLEYVATCRHCGAHLYATTELGRIGNKIDHFGSTGHFLYYNGTVEFDVRGDRAALEADR